MRAPYAIATLPLLFLGLAACGREAERLDRELAEARVALEQAHLTAQADFEAQAARLALEQALLADLGMLLRDAIAAAGAVEPGRGAASELVSTANRLLRAVSEHEELLRSSEAGLRLYADARMRAAAWLADPAVGLADRARALGRETFEAVQAAYLADERNRRLAAALGDAHVGLGRIEMAAGDPAAAAERYEVGIEALIASDKGRGDGTGSSEFQGDGSGGGGGKGKGKGKNRDQSLALNRHVMHAYAELTAVYRALEDPESEVRAINAARQTAAKLCQVMSNAEDAGYQFARVSFAHLIDELADAAERFAGLEAALSHEELALTILREIHLELPDDPAYFEPIVPQAVEVARRLAALGRVDALRELATQTLADLETLAGQGYPAARCAELEGRLRLEMARALAASDGHRAEAATWFAAVRDLAEKVRAEGGSKQAAKELESAAQTGLAAATE